MGCSDPLFGLLLAHPLPPTGTSVLTCVFEHFVFVLHLGSLGRNEKVVHSDTVRRRSAASLTGAWVPLSVVASAVLQLAQDQGRACINCDPQQRGPPGPELPGEMGKSTLMTKAAPASYVDASSCTSLSPLKPLA